jgi:SAM-dependent methyltransferase
MPMDKIRTSRNPLVTGPTRCLAWINHRHPWNHNEHFHGWILRNLPARRRSALDIGCGTGVLLAQLTDRFAQVTGVDADPGMAEAAGRRLATNPRASVQLSTLSAFAATADDGAFDVITMVAVLHHLDLRESLPLISRMIAPGGRLLVVSLASVASPADLAVDLVSAMLNPLVGLIKHPRAVRGSSGADGPVMPVKDPDLTFAEVALVARELLPGCSVRRRLFFRYSLYWERPS